MIKIMRSRIWFPQMNKYITGTVALERTSSLRILQMGWTKARTNIQYRIPSRKRSLASSRETIKSKTVHSHINQLNGHRITAAQEKTVLTRDVQMWKIFMIFNLNIQRRGRHRTRFRDSNSIGF